MGNAARHGSGASAPPHHLKRTSMRRSLLHGLAASCLVGLTAPAHADDWRPVRPKTPPIAVSASAAGLGRPVAVKAAETTTVFSLPNTADNDLGGAVAPVRTVGLELPRTIIRGQSPVGSEEQF